MNYKAYLDEALGVVGALLGIVAVNMTPEQVVSLLGLHGPGAIVIALGVLQYLRGRFSRVAATPPAPPSEVKSHWVVGALLAFVAAASLLGCKTVPTANERVGINAAVAAAVAITVQRNTNDPAVWAQRAQLIVGIGEAVKPLATTEAVSLPAVAAAVGPLLDKANLDPGERIAANQLVIALSQVIEANTNPDAATTATVAQVIDAAIENARVYVPLPAKSSTIF